MNVVINAPMSNNTIRSRMLINQSKETNWLQIKVIGTVTNHSAIGSKIKVFTGDICQTKEVHGGSSHASQNSLVQHFGLGTFESVDSILIYWLGDTIPQALYEINRNQKIEIVQSSDLSTSTNNFNNDLFYELVPNPAGNLIRLKTKRDINIKELHIINQSGQSLFNHRYFKLYKDQEFSLQLTQYSTGIYFIVIENENGLKNILKFVKQDQ
jgi:hypothetical protein